MGGEAKDEEGKEVVTHEVGMKRASKYIADQMLESRHLQALHGVLSSVWNRNGQAQSLPAVIALMEQYGVQLEAHEVEQICGMDQDQQIAALVNRMPQDSQEQFQQFFLQLQLLVSTATRIRDGLEDGQIEKVELALEDADSTGVTQEILRMAVVQAGHEAAVQMQEYEAWVKDTDEQMGRLIRGQEEAMAAKKKLATLLGGLQQDRLEHSERAAKVNQSFVESDRDFTRNACFQSWFAWAKRSKEEAAMTKNYQERIAVLRERRERYRSSSMHAIRGLLEKKALVREAERLRELLGSWAAVVSKRKLEEVTAREVEEMNARLAEVQGTQKETTKRVLERVNCAKTLNLLLQVLEGWHGEVQEMKKTTGMEKALKEAEARIRSYLKEKNGASLQVLTMALSGTDRNHALQAFACWKSEVIAAQEQAALEEARKENRKKVQAYKEKHFGAAKSAMGRFVMRYEEGLLLDVFGHWRIESAVEHAMERHESRLEAKRQQLHSIKQTFRSFAVQLKNNIKKSVDPETEKRPSLSRSGSQKLGSVSLPDIHKYRTEVQDSLPRAAWS